MQRTAKTKSSSTTKTKNCFSIPCSNLITDTRKNIVICNWQRWILC
jgi:hypothetical protein